MVCVCTGSRWANANGMCLIIYVCETDTMSWRGCTVCGCLFMGGAGVFIIGTEALKRTCFQDNGPGDYRDTTDASTKLSYCSLSVPASTGSVYFGIFTFKGVVSSNLALCKAKKKSYMTHMDASKRHIKY